MSRALFLHFRAPLPWFKNFHKSLAYFQRIEYSKAVPIFESRTFRFLWDLRQIQDGDERAGCLKGEQAVPARRMCCLIPAMTASRSTEGNRARPGLQGRPAISGCWSRMRMRERLIWSF